MEQHSGLLDCLQTFLDSGSNYEKERNECSNVAKAVGTVRNSVKNVSNVVTSAPGQLINKVDNAMEELSKALQVLL